jgi:DnaJ like chaperone protein
MTTTEGIVIVGGLVLGYWLVTVFLPHLRSGRDAREDAAAAASRPVEDDAATPHRPADPGQWHRPWPEVLEVSPHAPREVVVQAYRRRISQYHPDKVASMAPEIRALAEARSNEINVAYDRALYDLHQRGL